MSRGRSEAFGASSSSYSGDANEFWLEDLLFPRKKFQPPDLILMCVPAITRNWLFLITKARMANLGHLGTWHTHPEETHTIDY